MNTAIISHEDEFGFELLITSDGKSSHPRDPMPKLLADARVPERRWHATYDETKNRSEAFAMAERNLHQSQNRSAGFFASFLWLLVTFMPPFVDAPHSAMLAWPGSVLSIFSLIISMCAMLSARETLDAPQKSLAEVYRGN